MTNGNLSSAADGTTRVETDSLGAIAVPSEHYWGAQTQRSIRNFPFGQPMPLAVVHAFGQLKAACAEVNRDLGQLDASLCSAIVSAAEEVAAGALDAEFPLKIWQTGSGTQSNMNVNEVIASIANERATGTRGGKSPIHPNDDVNLSQSSNDAFPSAIHIAATLAVSKSLLPSLRHLHATISAKADAWSGIVKIGRTHLQDAVPLTLGQEFGAHAAALAGDIARIEAAQSELRAIALGGTAVGTGLNAHPEFAERAAKAIAKLTGEPIISAPNKFAALAGQEATLAASAALPLPPRRREDARWPRPGAS